jgi:protein gp37
MADLFGRWVPTEWILQVFDIVDQCPEWNFLFLTKFPQRLKEINDTLEGFPDNAWMGTTVDTQARVRVAEKAFSQIQAKVKWLSCEPLLEDLNFHSLDMFNWVVIGGQSASYFNGTPAVQPEWEWVENLWNQSRFSGCKIYWKENLTVRPKETPWT